MSYVVTSSDLVRVDQDSVSGLYLRSQFWFPVAVSNDLKVGRAKPAELLGTKMTIYRGQSGAVHAVASHCPHRHTSLATGYVEQETLRCLFHGWRFDADGNCLEQPLASICRLKEAQIAAYPVKEYLGLIFVFLGNKEKIPNMPEFPLFSEAGTIFSEQISDWPCNFFTMVEGATDWGHTVFTHRRSGLSDGLPTKFSFVSLESEFGISTFNRSEEIAALTNPTHFYMPCANFFDVPDLDPRQTLYCLVWRVPLNNISVRNFMVMFAPGMMSSDFMREKLGLIGELQPTTAEVGNSVLAGELSLDDILHRKDLIQIEDYVVQVGQLGPSVARQCLLTSADSGIQVAREIWLREVQSFIDAKPTKKWAHLSAVNILLGASYASSNL